MNKNLSETSFIINLLDKMCLIHKFLKQEIINIQTLMNIDNTQMKDICCREIKSPSDVMY